MWVLFWEPPVEVRDPNRTDGRMQLTLMLLNSLSARYAGTFFTHLTEGKGGFYFIFYPKYAAINAPCRKKRLTTVQNGVQE